ncbi:MAG: peptidase T [Spirochaetaceae bacterium]|nr:peptidase T [Spirochaetaceae bacterium]
MNFTNHLSKANAADALLKRFLSYVSNWTTSDSVAADNGVQPSTEQQWFFAKLLEEELKSIGVSDVTVTEHAYVCARIPATAGLEKVPSVCFLAHMDTVDEVDGRNVQPQVHKNYDGSIISLNGGTVLDPEKDKFLAESTGDTIITSDGTTLLGADDKAGIAIIMTGIAEIISGNIPHGQLEIVFSPDEETGHGMDNVPLGWFHSTQCYTFDGGHAGEIEIECFNAYKAEIQFNGKAKHTGTARPDMVNAISMASSFVQMLPPCERPETTDGRQGFYAPMEISGHIESAKVVLFLRDFETDGMERRISTVKQLAAAAASQYPGGSAEVKVTQQYLNMFQKIQKKPLVAEILKEALLKTGIEPKLMPIRGGTDGSRLTELGLPTPNVFTGGHNFHSKSEWASLSQMVCAEEVLVELVKLWAAQKK